MEILDENKVLHVALLAHIKLSSEEVDLYKNQLNDIVKEIRKIEEVNINTNDIMITSTPNKNCYKEDTVGTMDKREDILKNAKKTNGDYIVVPKVLND